MATPTTPSAPPSPPPAGPPRRPLLSLRAIVVLSLSTIIGIVAGGLTYLNGESVPAALLAGGAAWGASLAIINPITGD